MLTTLTIIGIFTEIFAAGILLAGARTFFKNFFTSKQPKDLILSLIFLGLFVYVGLTIASQLMFNQGRELSLLILIHKIIAINIIICASLLGVFIVEKFNLKMVRWAYPGLGVLAALFVIRVFNSTVNLIYREGVIEPIVDFSLATPVKAFFAVMFLLLFVAALISAFMSRDGKRSLTFYLAGSSLFLLVAVICSFLYARSGEAGYLLFSWVLTLVASLGVLLAEVIPQDSPEARKPLRFLRTRILFKLMLIFVLLIVILFETTTLATINISKQALSKEIINNYVKMVDDLTVTTGNIQQSIRNVSTKNWETAFIVDGQGRLLFHPDQKRALQRDDLTSHQAVAALLRGQRGSGEFRDELGSLMVGAYVPLPRAGGGVVIQSPVDQAYAKLRELETNSLLFVISGIIMTALAGIFFARSIDKPIKDLTQGAEAVSKGDLRWQVKADSIDEIGKLATAFNRMTKELRDSQERLVLSEKLASLGTMAAGMAHEIKNPLVSVRTFTQLLQHKWEDPEFRQKFSSIIPQEIERINRIAESLLKFGKPMKPELSRVDVNALLDEVLLLFESESKKHNVRVTKKLSDLPEISGDAGQLQQVFVNMVKNGIEAMQEKGGELVVKSEVGEVVKLGKMQRQGLKQGDEMIWGEGEELAKPLPVVFIEISDTGEGIPEDNLKSLFDPFFTTKMTGTGMGLPITLRIIEDHKGSVKVKSQKDKGTTFIITLPQRLV